MHTAKQQKNEEGEIWMSPPSLDRSWVEVSNLGRMRTLDHKTKCVRDGFPRKQSFKGRIRQTNLDTRGRPIYQFYEVATKKKNAKLIRDLVAECFVPNPNHYRYLIHKNHDQGDVRAANLQYVSKEDWLQHCREKMFCINPTTGHRKILISKKPNGEEVEAVCLGICHAGEYLGCTKQNVGYALKSGQKCKGRYISFAMEAAVTPHPPTREKKPPKVDKTKEMDEFPSILFG